MSKEEQKNNIEWQKPSLKKLGKAKDLIKAINTVGSGDAQFSVLNS